MSAFDVPSVQALGEWEGSLQSTRQEGDMLYFLGGNLRGRVAVK